MAVADDEPVAGRVDRVLDLVRGIAADHDVVVLPELWTIGAFSIDAMAAAAAPLASQLRDRLAEVSATTSCWLFAGSIPELAPDGRRYNTQLVLDDRGQQVASYRKIHLFGFAGGETTVLSAGSQLVDLDSPLGRTGLATCYDLRFPELFRALVDRGCQSFVIPSGWPARRATHWNVLARARAIEDQAFVLACNTAGTHARVPMAGGSMVIDPYGDVLAQAGEGEEVLSAEVDLDRVSAWRSAFPALADRRSW